MQWYGRIFGCDKINVTLNRLHEHLGHVLYIIIDTETAAGVKK
jgi:hypothetical protein